jgi:hypothetical protein
MRALRLLWALPYTIVGLVVAGVARAGGGTTQVRDGVVEAWGGPLQALPRLPLAGGIGAITFDHVVLATHEKQMGWSRIHERAHVRQYERWGPLFGPAYLLNALLIRLRGGDAYTDNRFEREAREAEAKAKKDGSPAEAGPG